TTISVATAQTARMPARRCDAPCVTRTPSRNESVEAASRRTIPGRRSINYSIGNFASGLCLPVSTGEVGKLHGRAIFGNGHLRERTGRGPRGGIVGVHVRRQSLPDTLNQPIRHDEV